jgi:hypothetical protein
LVNVADPDFMVGQTAHQLYNEYRRRDDFSDPDHDDLFHIYLSKLSYELPHRIREHCTGWGFHNNSIRIFNYVQTDDLRRYTYSTQAVAIHYAASNRILIAFRGTEPIDLLQWLTDASTNFVNISHRFRALNHSNKEIRVHAGFFYALGLDHCNPSEQIDFNLITEQTPIFIQLLNFIRTHDNDNNNKCKISITGHSLGGALASLFSFVLLAYDYESSISGVYTYGQPLVGNRCYAEILNNKLGKRYHRWVNHDDIVARMPLIQLPSIAWYYGQTPYSDALEATANNNQTLSDHYYYHSGLRFRIDGQGNLRKEDSIDEGPILGHQDKIDLFDVTYSIKNIFSSFFKISPIRCFSWLAVPNEINDHFPGDYARKIKKIIKEYNKTTIM